LIQDSSIDGAEAVDFIRRQETESTETVLDSYSNERVVVSVDYGLHILLAVSKSISTTMDPDKYREIGCILRSINVKEQTILI